MSPTPATLASRPDLFAQVLLGVELHPGQAEWLQCRARIKIACCGRRWGKSYSEAADLIWFAVTHHDTQQFLVAPTHDQSTIIFQYVVRMLHESPLSSYIEKIVYSPFPEIRLKNDSIIRARSTGNDGTNLRGHGADRIILDEAAFIGGEVFTTISPLLATSRFGELVLISTPFGRNTFWEYWQRGQGDDPDVQSFRYPSSSNPYLSQAYLEGERRDRTSLAYAVEYEAEFREDQNNVFPYTLVESCVRPGLESEPVYGHRYVIGYDPAKWADRSGVVVLDVSTKPWQVARCFDLSGRDYLVQAPQIGLLSQHYGYRPAVLLDATSHDQMLEQLLADGVNAEGFQFTNTSKQELINGLVIAMEQGEVVIPNHHDLMTELAYYRYELTAAGNVKLGADSKHHDDLVTALALAVHCAKQPHGGGMLLATPSSAASAPGAFSTRLNKHSKRSF